MIGLHKGKGEGIKGCAGSQPYKAALPGVYVRFVGIGITGTYPAVQAIGGNEQVCPILLGNVLVVSYVSFKHQTHTQLLTALLQDVQQLFAAYAYETVTTTPQALPFIVDLDVIPIIETRKHVVTGKSWYVRV